MRKIGIYNPYLETRGGGEKVCLALAELLSKQPDTEVYMITHKKSDLVPLANYFKVNLDNVHVMAITFHSFWHKILDRLPLPGAVKNLSHDLRVYRQSKKAGFDLFINNCYQNNMPGPGKKNVYMCMFPQQINPKAKNVGAIKSIYSRIMRNVYRLLLHPKAKHAVYTYDAITANSAYTQRYIKKYWGLNSDILYPICQSMKNGAKRSKIILSVGRFFENNGENHHKRHDFLISTFAKMKDLQKEGWELHLAGSVAEDVGTLKYLLSLLHKCEGLPISLHFNTPFPELKRLFNEASIYWHATGYGSNPNKHPEKQEHFGITTVEAMSAGAIPVVIDSAGQKESVEPGENGYLWKNEKELVQNTQDVTNASAAKLASLRENAIKTAKRYNQDSFAKWCTNYFAQFL